MNTFLVFRCGIRVLYFFFLIWLKSTNIENRVQIWPIRLQIFFRGSDNRRYVDNISGKCIETNKRFRNFIKPFMTNTAILQAMTKL